MAIIKEALENNIEPDDAQHVYDGEPAILRRAPLNDGSGREITIAAVCPDMTHSWNYFAGIIDDQTVIKSVRIQPVKNWNIPVDCDLAVEKLRDLLT